VFSVPKRIHFIINNYEIKNNFFFFLETVRCKHRESNDYPSLCFSFKIPSDVDVNTVESSQLWVYKEPSMCLII
jgi:hypothetical protein